MISEIKRIYVPEGAEITAATVSHSAMGERTVQCTVYVDGSSSPDFTREWEIEWRGERYVMPLRFPQAAKENTTLDSRLDLTFEHKAERELKRWYFHTLQAVESGTAIPDEFVTPVTLSLRDFTALLNEVLAYYYSDGIRIRARLNEGYAGESGAVTIEVSYTKIWDVLRAMSENYDVRWSIVAEQGVADSYVIEIGYAPEELTHAFEYGFEGGLLKVERQVQDTDLSNIMYGRGGDKNLPYRYFKQHDEENATYSPDPDWIPELAEIPFTNLRGATFRSYIQGWNHRRYKRTAVREAARAYAPWAWMRGYTDAKFHPVEFVADAYNTLLDGYNVVAGSSIDRYGPIVGGMEANEEIYPTLQGVTIEGMGRVDECVDVEPITTDDIEGTVKRENRLTDVAGGEGSATMTCQVNATATILVASGQFTVGEGKTAAFEAAEAVDVVGYLDYYAIHSVWPRKNKEWWLPVAPGVVEVTGNSLRVYDSDGNERTASGLTPGGYTFRYEVSVRCTTDTEGHPLGEHERRLLPMRVSASVVGFRLIESDAAPTYQGTWHIWVKNLWQSSKGEGESASEYAERVWRPILGDRTGESAKVVFSSGWLSISEDYEFVITKIPEYAPGRKLYEFGDGTKSTDKTLAALHGGLAATYESEWKVCLGRCDADLESTGKYTPNMRTQAKAGDTFFFTGIDMPHLYVVKAEERLDDWKKDQLREYSEIRPTWVVTFDPVRIGGGGAADALIHQLHAGAKVRLRDKRFIQGEEELYIETMTVTYSDARSGSTSLVPQVEVTLASKITPQGNVVSRLSGEVTALQRAIGSVSAVEQTVRAIGDKLYLRKDGQEERSLSPTDFAARISGGGFRQGSIGGEGWGFYQDSNGGWVLETDRITVRKDMTVNTLVVNQCEGRGGMSIDTCATGKINKVLMRGGDYECHLDLKQGSVGNLWREGDIAMCVEFNSDWNRVRYYQRRVKEVEGDMILLAGTPMGTVLADGSTDSGIDGEAVPAVGDEVVQYGSYEDAGRQYVKVRDVVDGGYERYIEGLDRVGAAGVEYFFVGRQAGMYGGRPRWFIGDENGYIEYREGGLDIKARLSVESTVEGRRIDSYVDSVAQARADEALREAQRQLEHEREELQRQIDGVVEAWNGTADPTPGNYPASEWDTDAKRQAHVGDVYYNIGPYSESNPNAGGAWRWYYNSASDYGWVQIADSDAVKALQLAHRSVTNTDVYFIAVSPSGGTPALPTVSGDQVTAWNGWSTDSPAWDSSKQIWQCTGVWYGDGRITFSDPTCVSGRNGRGIVSVTEYYAVTSSTVQPTEWSLTVPFTSTSQPYLWNYERTEYTDGTVSESPKRVIGVHGQNGNGISKVTNYYLASASASGVTVQTPGWTEVAASGNATMTEEKPYLWNYEEIEHTQSATTRVGPRIIGRYGADGTGVASVTEEYYLSSSRLEPEGGAWSATRPQWKSGWYYWTRTVIRYTDGRSETLAAICVTGETGEAAPTLMSQYSADGTSWHATYSSSDIYIRTSADGGVTWSGAMRFRGMDGANGVNYTVNRIYNGAFDRGTEGWTLATGDGILELTEHSGKKCVHLAHWMSGTIRPYMDAPVIGAVSAGRSYTLSMWVYSEGGSLMAFGLESKSLGSGPWSTASVAQGVQRIHVTFTPDCDADDAYIRVTVSTAALIDCYISEVKLEDGVNDTPQWNPAPSEMVGADGKWRKWQWAKNTSPTTAPTSGWQDEPLTAAAGEYVWMRGGEVIPPATAPASWDSAVRLTGDRGTDGADVFTLDIDNEVIGIPCLADGTVVAGTTYPRPKATMYKGAGKVSGVVWSIAGTDGVNASIASDGTVTLSGLSKDSATATVQAKSGTVTLQSTISLYKVKPGATGPQGATGATGAAASVYSIDTDPASVTVAYDGTASATRVTATKCVTTGNTGRSATTQKGLVRQFHYPNGTVEEATVSANGASSSATVTIPSGCSAVVFLLYDTDGVTVLDRERVPVLRDSTDMDVCGENLVRNSGRWTRETDNRPPRHWNWLNNPGLTTYNADGTLNFTSGWRNPQWGDNGFSGIQSAVIDIPAGKTVTLTARLAVTGITSGANVEVKLMSTDYAVQKTAQSITADGALDVAWRWTNNTNKTQFRVAFSTTRFDGTVWIKNVALRFGNTQMEWSPCPEDTDYLQSALADAASESTTIEGGLILTSAIQTGYTDSSGNRKVMAGMNGVYNGDTTPSIWAGGDGTDLAESSTEDAARFLIRMDGTGYAAGNTLRFKESQIGIGRTSAGNDVLTLDAAGMHMIDEASGEANLEVGKIGIAGTNIEDYVNPNSYFETRVGGLYMNGNGPVPYNGNMVYTAGGTSEEVMPARTMPRGALLVGSVYFNLSIGSSYTLEAECRVRLYGGANATTLLKTWRWNTLLDGTYKLSNTINFGYTIPSDGRYRVVAEISNTLGGSPKTTNPDITWNLHGYGGSENQRSTRTILGKDGFATVWGKTLLIADRNHGVLMRAGKFGLRVTQAGIQYNKDGSDNWTALV